MVALPGATPVTTPDNEFTVAAAVLLLLQLPPPLPLLVNVVAKPVQTDGAPFTTPAFGTGFTVMVVVVEVTAQRVVTV